MPLKIHSAAAACHSVAVAKVLFSMSGFLSDVLLSDDFPAFFECILQLANVHTPVNI